jgi:hypothetical protein
MCHADISPVLWAWNPKTDAPAALIYNDHTCRDFDRIHEWAMKRKVSVGWWKHGDQHGGHDALDPHRGHDAA